MKIGAGELLEVVTLRQRAAGVDAYGQESATFTDFAAGVPAKVITLRGQEFFAAGQALDAVLLRVFVRWMSGVTPQMQLVWGGRKFDVQSVADVDNRRDVLELMCTSAAKDAVT